MAGRTTLTLRPGMTRLNENTVLNVKNTSFTVTARATLPDDAPAQGALIAQGGSFGGWALYFVDGRLCYAHNWVGLETYVVRSDEPVAGGAHELGMRFEYDGGGTGKGGDVTLTCDGTTIGTGRVEKTVPGVFSFDEGLDIGLDSLDPVVREYTTPKGRFTGTIDAVVVDIAPDAEQDADMVLRAKYRKQ
jgi:arylsulfatase